MLLRHRTGEPERHEIAVYNPSATLDNYQAEITDARRHWQKEQDRAVHTGSEALLVMSQSIINSLMVPILVLKDEGSYPYTLSDRFIPEESRRTVLSTLGISMLLRHEWTDESEAEPEFVGPDGELDTIIDMLVDVRSWRDFRVHAPIAVQDAHPDGAAEQWYRECDLWVRQVRPADPTDYLIDDFLPSLGIKADLSGHETLFPYVAAK